MIILRAHDPVRTILQCIWHEYNDSWTIYVSQDTGFGIDELEGSFGWLEMEVLRVMWAE